MVKVIVSPQFERDIKHLKDNSMKERLAKEIFKIKENPGTGKPLRYNLKGERSVRVKPFRIIYTFDDNILYLLKFEHRKKAYK